MKNPFQGTVVAKKHTPIYSVHRYFARRPHNVFSAIIEHYLDRPSVVLDPFMGGGVTAVEGLTLGHRVIGHEVNALACFIAEGELSAVDPTAIEDAVEQCLAFCRSRLAFTYTIGEREVYWYGWDSITKCSNCGKETRLAAENSFGSGSYECRNCRRVFRPRRVGSSSIAPSSVCVFSSEPRSPGEVALLRISSKRLVAHHESIEAKLGLTSFTLAEKKKTPIPQCNLERESALHSKGFRYFEDFVTSKNQAWILCFSEAIRRGRFDPETEGALYYILSAAIRYFSRFSCLNPAWRKGLRPLEWAKSNFWTPYSFVEVNPSVAIRERLDAYLAASTDHRQRFSRKLTKGSARDVLESAADYAVVNKPSQSIDLPDNSIDFILTDPPYGSYLNYGELSGFWLSWLRRVNPKLRDVSIINAEEAVTSRKKHSENYKDFGDYERELSAVFLESYRVLKPGSYMVFTFNNKEPEAWIALLRSVKRAGFVLPEGGVTFQDGVEAYKRTIALRREGAIHGDFIYSFVKPAKECRKSGNGRAGKNLDWRAEVVGVIDVLFRDQRTIRNTDLFLEINRSLLPSIFRQLDLRGGLSALSDFTMRNLNAVLEERLIFVGGFWRMAHDRSRSKTLPSL